MRRGAWDVRREVPLFAFTGHWPLFSHHSPPAIRHSRLRVRRPGIGSAWHALHATKCYVFPVFSKIRQARFPRNLLYYRRLWLFVSGAHLTSIRLNCMIEKELRHNQLRSLFRKKPRFCSLFGSFYPHFANQLALRAAGASAQPAPVNLVGPQRAPGHCSAAPHFTPLAPAPRHTSHATPAGSGRAQTVPRWLLPDTDSRISKDQTGPDLDERHHYIQYVTEPGDSCEQINPFLPTRRRSPVDHSLVAGGAQRQSLQACLPDRHTAQCLSFSCFMSILTPNDEPKNDSRTLIRFWPMLSFVG